MLLLMRGKVPRYVDTQFHQNDSDGVARSYLPATGPVGSVVGLERRLGIVEDVHRVSEAGRRSSMGRRRYEVAPDGDRWVVREGRRATPALATKELAVDAAVRRAKGDAPAEVVVLDEEGAIETERMFD
jgi:hypothetical protein